MTAPLGMEPGIWYPDTAEDAPKGYPWQPAVMFRSRTPIAGLGIWFATEGECIDWMRTYLIGAVLDEDSDLRTRCPWCDCTTATVCDYHARRIAEHGPTR